eukprot:maker-scaffold72_size415059-snap-gene-1.16 protein:Tk08666 transcript:maker-scaffold72_size415059-snap-gene-1.16-mRNA-1 annotation:"ring finger membrane protein"
MSVVLLVVFAVITLFAVFGGISLYLLLQKCRNQDRDEEKPPYSVAVSNHLFKDDITKNDLPCLNCHLIEMGDMACYEELCPQCGQAPPGKKEYLEEKKIKHLKKFDKARSVSAEDEEDAASEMAKCSRLRALCRSRKESQEHGHNSENSSDQDQPEYNVAMSNHLFKDENLGMDLPCMNCKLIEMGSMACYEGICPECGKEPPNQDFDDFDDDDDEPTKESQSQDILPTNALGTPSELESVVVEQSEAGAVPMDHNHAGRGDQLV